MNHRLPPESFQRTSRICHHCTFPGRHNPLKRKQPLLSSFSQLKIKFKLLSTLLTVILLAISAITAEAGGKEYLVTGLEGSVQFLLVDNGYVYWCEWGGCTPNCGNIRKVSVNGGDFITLASETYPTRMAIDNGWLYYAASGCIKKVAKIGGPITTLAVGNALGIAIAGEYIYWGDVGSWEAGTGYLKRIKTDATQIESETILSGLNTPSAMKADGGYLYFTEAGIGPNGSNTGGRIKKLSLNDFSLTVLADNQTGAFAMEVDNQNVYWICDNSLKKVPKNGGQIITMAPASYSNIMDQIVSDGTWVYWVNNNISQIYKMPTIGGDPISFKPYAGSFGGIAIDSSSIYSAWYELNGTVIYKLPRNPFLSFDQNPPNLAIVGSPFPITITAQVGGTLDTTFNANVTLSCPGVQLNTASVNLANGIWTGQVKINYGGGANLVIQAGGGGLTGKSNSFSTTNAATAKGNLYGLVTDDGAIVNTPLPNAAVHLSLTANGPDAYTAQTTDANGRFTFTGVAAGSYYLWATYSGASSDPKYQVRISSGSMAKSLTVPTAGDPSKLPVILVPGITGSNDKDRYVVYPRLPKADYDRNQLQIHDPAGKAGWQDLKEILGPHGKNVKVVDCPWDWRMPIDQAMKKYLKDAIREAKGGNANQKVNIIAHSMGGLLARAYIQGDDYQNDVENLVLVGTPHTGSANAYYFWEGGDPETVDNFSPFGNIVGYYANTIKKLMQDLKWPLTGEQDYQNKRTFISSHMPTARQLLPTYAFLDHGSGPQPIATSWDINYDLKDLNNDPRRSERMGPPNTTTPGVVKTRVYYSGSENTVGNVHVRNTTLQGCYEDGQPDGSVAYVLGDGTVKTTSATLPVQENWADGIVMPGECDHLSLIKNAKNLIADFLYPTVAKAMVFKEAADATLPPSFFMTYDGWLQPYLADSQGRAVGFNLTNGALENTIPQARLVTEADCGSLAVDNPADGNYTLSLKGKFSGAYRVTIGYQSGGNFVTRDLEGFNNANTTTITVMVDSTNPAKIIINPQVPAPTAMVASNVQGKTKLTWQASPGAVSYQIYAMLPGASDYTLIGSTSGTTLLTNDPWLMDSSATPTVYVIVAVKADGTTSFFSNTAVNKTIPNKKTNMAPIYNLLLTD